MMVAYSWHISIVHYIFTPRITKQESDGYYDLIWTTSKITTLPSQEAANQNMTNEFENCAFIPQIFTRKKDASSDGQYIRMKVGGTVIARELDTFSASQRLTQLTLFLQLPSGSQIPTNIP